VECCKEAIAKLQSDTDHLTESSRQRLVAEFVAGVVRGSKYWSFNQVSLQPIRVQHVIYVVIYTGDAQDVMCCVADE